jgi:hypothetical protein
MLAGRAAFDIFPIREKDADLLIWEQQDNYTGLMQVRGLNGAPPRVKPVGYKRYQMEPGVYGEHSEVDEAELVRRARPASFTEFISINDLVAEKQMQLMARQFDRFELIIWNLLVTGTFSVPGPTGAVLHTDSYTLQTFSAGTAWSTSATSTPLADMRSAQLLALGHGAVFDATAKAYMNQVTFNNLISNSNATDLYGRRTQGFGTFNGPKQIAELFMGDNLPQIIVYEGGYIPDGGTFTRFIPNNKVVLVGRRTTNADIGEFRLTRNACNPNMGPGVYTNVVDFRNMGHIPPKIEVHRDVNGGPVIYFPSSMVVMSV